MLRATGHARMVIISFLNPPLLNWATEKRDKKYNCSVLSDMIGLDPFGDERGARNPCSLPNH